MTAKEEHDVTNKLAVIQRTNVRQLMEQNGIDTHKDMAAIVGEVSSQTFGNSFGNNARTDPSKKTLRLIYEAFPSLPSGSLDIVDGVPSMAPPADSESENSAKLPAVILMEEVTVKIGKTTIHSEIPLERVEALISYLIFGDKLL